MKVSVSPKWLGHPVSGPGSPVRGSVMVSRVWVLVTGGSWDTGTRGSRDSVGSSTSGVTMADMSGILSRNIVRHFGIL